jgi:hypothetical protein
MSLPKNVLQSEKQDIVTSRQASKRNFQGLDKLSLMSTSGGL